VPDIHGHRRCSGLLAAGVIILSLIAASISLPHLLKGLALPPEPSQQEDEDRARVAAAEAAIRAVERAQHDMGEGRSDADLYADAGARIMELYRQRSTAARRAARKARWQGRSTRLSESSVSPGSAPNATKSFRSLAAANSPMRWHVNWCERSICWKRDSARSNAALYPSGERTPFNQPFAFGRSARISRNAWQESPLLDLARSSRTTPFMDTV
jgi:hypothetical protein